MKKPVPSDEDKAETARKAWNAAEAKVRRICCPKEVSGKVEADAGTLALWRDLTGGRDQLIQMMLDCNGKKACYVTT